MLEIITLGAGCFWCVEAVFQNIEGVLDVRSGYTGGITENPTYEDVCQGNTNHAEAVKISFNSNIITFESLLDIFFETVPSSALLSYFSLLHRLQFFPSLPQ